MWLGCLKCLISAFFKPLQHLHSNRSQTAMPVEHKILFILFCFIFSKLGTLIPLSSPHKRVRRKSRLLVGSKTSVHGDVKVRIPGENQGGNDFLDWFC